MRASELGPLFTSAYTGWNPFSRAGSEQTSATIHTIAGLQSPVFLINSRTPLVIETYYLHSRHPFYLRYRARLPNSLNVVSPWRLGLFSQGHPSRLWVRLLQILVHILFMESRPQPNIAAVPRFHFLLAMMALQKCILVKRTDECAWSSQNCQMCTSCCQKCIGIVPEYEPVSLSFFAVLRKKLGSTNP